MKKRVGSNYTLITVFLICLVAVGFVFFQSAQRKQGENKDKYAVLAWDNHEMLRVDLSQQEDGFIDLRERYDIPGVLEVKNKNIRFFQVDCPDKICEKTGFLKYASDTAVCLPNKLTLKIYAKEPEQEKVQ